MLGTDKDYKAITSDVIIIYLLYINDPPLTIDRVLSRTIDLYTGTKYAYSFF